MSKFSIDFFELSFLAEACIPPRPIARAFFWQNLTNVYWFQMSENERAKLFSWLNRNTWYEERLKKEEDTKIFHARFNPDNQYMVKTIYDGKEEESRAFLYDDNYYTKINTYISKQYIKEVNKLNLKIDQ